jgi:type IV secretory pathway VirB2 component (pilin)
VRTNQDPAVPAVIAQNDTPATPGDQVTPALIGPSGFLFRAIAWSITGLVALFGLLIGFAFVLHWCARVSIAFLARQARSLRAAATRGPGHRPVLHPPAGGR